MKKKFKIRKNKFGFYQIYPSPSQKQITKFYADEFYSGEYKNFNDSALEVQLKDKEFFNGRWQDVYENLLEIKKKFKKGSSILDIGCVGASFIIKNILIVVVAIAYYYYYFVLQKNKEYEIVI